MAELFHQDKSSVVQVTALLLRNARASIKYADKCFYDTLQISLVKFIVLQSLTIHKGTMSSSKLAAFTSTERHNITTLLNRMERDGLITTRRDEKDRRAINVSLTNEGASVLSKAVPVARHISDTLMLSVPEDDHGKLLENLVTIYENALEGLALPDTKPR